MEVIVPTRFPLTAVHQLPNEMLNLIAAFEEFSGKWRALGGLGPET
jgi:hypothetical protein